MNRNNHKHNLRNKVKKQRTNLSFARQQQAAKMLNYRLLKNPRLRKATKIGIYLTVNGEINLQPFISWCQKHHKVLYVPQITNINHGKMQFVKFNEQNLSINQFNILEPKSSSKIINICCLDAMIIPLIAFDKQLNRLGMGGGFYDRILSKVRFKNKPLKVGVAHDFQQVRAVPRQKHDIKMHQIVTNRTTFKK